MLFFVGGSPSFIAADHLNIIRNYTNDVNTLTAVTTSLFPHSLISTQIAGNCAACWRPFGLGLRNFRVASFSYHSIRGWDERLNCSKLLQSGLFMLGETSTQGTDV